MKLPSYRRLYKADYPSQYQSLVDQLSNSINSAFDSVFGVLNRNTSLRDNILCSVRDVTVQVDSKGTPLGTASMTLDQANQVDGISIINVTNLTTTGVYPTGAPFISYTINSTGIIFNNITGLQPGYQWQLRCVAWQK